MELLQKLTSCISPSGNESKITDLIKESIKPYVDEVYTDILGNVIAHKKGNGKKIMIAAHADEIGIIVTYIDKKGFLRFAPVGGLDVKNLIHRRVIFQNGTVGVIGIDEDEQKPSVSKMFIDIGCSSREESEKSVGIGNTAVFYGDMVISQNKVISKALDNRVGCYVAIKASEQLKKMQCDNDLYFVFTAQEEVGLRGAKTAAFGIDPEFAIAIDVTDTGDTPEFTKMAVSCGGGAAIKIMDRSILCHSDIRTGLIECAKKHNIKYQLEIMNDGGTDAGAIHLTKAGVKTGGISIPTRYIHSPNEMVDLSDIDDCISLLANYLCEVQ